MTSLKKWNSEEYEIAITQWIIRRLREMGIRETHFSRNAGLGKSETDARTFRKIKEGKRRWSVVDLCKVAGFFNETPAAILKQVETFYASEGIVRPGITAEKIFSMGFAGKKKGGPLISTWKKKGKTFALVDCDPEWKKATGGSFSMIMGMNSSDIFKPYPEVTALFEDAFKKNGVSSLHVWYGRRKRINLPSGETETTERWLIFIEAVFVPPDGVVVYAKDVTSVAG